MTIQRHLILIMACFCCQMQSVAQVGIGHWRDHSSFSHITCLTASKHQIFGCAENVICYYNYEDWTTDRIDKINALSDVSISTMAYDNSTKVLVVAYSNGNIDLIFDNEVHNLSDIKRGNISGSKGIHGITFHDHLAYLACDFGIVVIDIRRKEIKDTYYIGENGETLPVTDIAFSSNRIIATTQRGLMSAPADDRFLNIFSHWTADTNLLPRDEVPFLVETHGNQLAVVTKTFEPDVQKLYRQEPNGSLSVIDSGEIKSLRMTENRIIVCHWSKVDVLDSNFNLLFTVNGEGTWSGMQANDALLVGDTMMWVAHNWAGLVAFDTKGRYDTYPFSPSAPNSNANYRIIPSLSRILVCPGGKQTTNANIGLSANINIFRNNHWDALQGTAKDTLMDLIDVAVDPLDSTHWMAASWGNGIIEIQHDSIINVYNESNTNHVLTPYKSTNFRSLRTGGVAFDPEGNLWVTNSLNANSLAVRHTDGTWKGFNTESMVARAEVDKIIYDSIHGYKLFAGSANKIFVHDGESKQAYIDPNYGSKMNTIAVNCMAQDQSGDIWIGTNKGIKVIYDLYKAFERGGRGELSPVTCSNIIINEGEIVEYLMAYESITCIAVDGANRKWVGTAAGGLYLLSSNGLEELAHFNTTNSPLFSDKIISIAIQPLTGEVFVGTDKGMLSYRSTATYAEALPSNDIHAFPNPVKPGYNGPIAIKGFTRNAMVHITDAAGHVVFSTQALGGQAIWYGKTNSGEPVASGVYYVFAADENGGNRSVTKILIIR